MKNFMNFDVAIQRTFENADELACFSKLMVDTAKGNIQQYSKEEANAKIREKMFAVLGIDETASRRELRKAIRRNRVAVFEVIEDTIEDLLASGWGENPFFREFVDIRNIADGDKNEFYIPDNSILTVSQLSGGHHDLLRQKIGAGKLISVPTKWYGVKIYDEYELFMSGRVDWAAMINKVYEAMDYHVNSLLYAAFIGASSELPQGTDYKKTGTLTKANLLELAENVEMATGREAVIMGTRSALSKVYALSDASWISNQMKDERNTTGKLGVWEGYEIGEIPQVLAKNDPTRANALIASNTLFVMPKDSANKFVKLVNEGDAQIREINDGATNMDMTIEYEYQAKLGIGVVVNMLFGVYTISQ